MSRFTLPAAVLLLLRKNDEVLLMKRLNTRFGSGDYDLVAGHIDGDEHLTRALLREAKEEVGITFDPNDAHFVHLTHSLADQGKEYLLITFEVKKYQGTPTILEPEKCDDLRWFPLASLPPNITPSAKAALEAYLKNEQYTEIIA